MTKQRNAAAVSPEGEIFSDNQESGLTDAINIDFAKIPEHTRDDIAAITLGCVKSFLQQPGGREALAAKIVMKKRTKGAVH